MSRRYDKRHLLRSLLTVVVQEWGPEEVRRCLAELEIEALGTTSDQGSGRDSRTRPPSPSAVDLAKRADASEARRSLLVAIASKFDARAFLPTGGDVRHFLEMRGQQVSAIKKRPDAFRKVLALLLTMADDELRVLAETEAHGGPTQLGPLSDAIKATGAAVRTLRQEESELTRVDAEPKEGS